MSKIHKLKKKLHDKCACYVLITCSPPNKEGKMEVEMDYEGDEILAAFLVENAAQVFDNHMCQKESAPL